MTPATPERKSLLITLLMLVIMLKSCAVAKHASHCSRGFKVTYKLNNYWGVDEAQIAAYFDSTAFRDAVKGVDGGVKPDDLCCWKVVRIHTCRKTGEVMGVADASDPCTKAEVTLALWTTPKFKQSQLATDGEVLKNLERGFVGYRIKSARQGKRSKQSDACPAELGCNYCSDCPSYQPNIIVILGDDMGWQDVEYNGANFKTPNLNKMASEGVRLDNYYSMHVCTPARAAFLTGRYPMRYGLQHYVIVGDMPTGLSLNESTLPKVLRTAGYRAHGVGKWHLGFADERFLPTSNGGFESFVGFMDGDNTYFTHLTPEKGNLTSPPAPEDQWVYDFRDGDSCLVPRSEYQGKYNTEYFTDKAIEVIEAHDESEPLFLFLAYNAIHRPLEVNQSYIQPYECVPDEARRNVSGMGAALDQNIGRVLESLQHKGDEFWQQTLVFFFSDNGGQSLNGGGANWPYRGMNATLWEGGIKVPAIAYGPPLQCKGRNEGGLMHVVDWFTTICSLGKVTAPLPNPVDGYNMWSVISRGQPSPRTGFLINLDPWYNIGGLLPATFASPTASQLVRFFEDTAAEGSYLYYSGLDSLLNAEYGTLPPIVQKILAALASDLATWSGIRDDDRLGNRWKLLIGWPAALCNLLAFPAIASIIAPNTTHVYQRVCGHFRYERCPSQSGLSEQLNETTQFVTEPAGIYSDLYNTASVSFDNLPMVLYNLRDDPLELINVARLRPAVVQRLLDKIKTEYVPGLVAPVVPPFCCDPQPGPYRAAAVNCASPWLTSAPL